MGLLQSALQQQTARLIYRRGIGYEQRQLHKQAIASFTQAIAKGYTPTAKALIHRGISRLNTQNTAGAIADFDAVIQTAIQQNDASSYLAAQALFFKGKIYRQKGDNKAAWISWAAAIDYCPTYAQPYYHRALFLIEQDRPNKALSDLDAAIEIDPSMAIAYLQRGNLRYQTGNIEGAIFDWQHALCNDFTLKSAKQALAKLQHDTYQDQLSQVLVAPLAEKELSVKVRYQSDRSQDSSQSNCLNIYVHRETGKGVNYYTLPDLIRQHLVPLQLDSISRFRLIGTVGNATGPDWDKSYDLYKNQPCPPSNWQAAIFATLLFPPLAVPAFIQAASVKRTYAKGKYINALNASKLVGIFSAASSIPFCFFVFLMVICASYDETGIKFSDRPAVRIVSCSKDSYSLCIKTTPGL